MGCDLVEVSAHVGARNKGVGPMNHESWQGRVYSRSGSSEKYPDFIKITGYGTGEGLGGWNCQHGFHVWFEGISERAYTDQELAEFANMKVMYNGKEMSLYEGTQVQRGIERKIREWKRRASALEESGLKDPDTLADLAKANSKVKEWQGEMRKFVKETGLSRDRPREQISFAQPKILTFADDGGGGNLYDYPKPDIQHNYDNMLCDFGAEDEDVKKYREVLDNWEKVNKPAILEKPIDRDLQLAQQGKLFSFDLNHDDVISTKPIDYSKLYNNDAIKAKQITFLIDEKAYVVRGHNNDALWALAHQDIILRAITNPIWIDTVPRLQKKSGINIAHIISTGEDELPFLNVVLNFRKGKDNAQIWTMFRVGREYIYDSSGNILDRWRLPK